jgi:hypothetical protein
MEGDLVEVIAQLNRWLESKTSLAVGVYSPGIQVVLMGTIVSRIDEEAFLFATPNADVRVPIVLPSYGAVALKIRDGHISIEVNKPRSRPDSDNALVIQEKWTETELLQQVPPITSVIQ